MENETWIDGWVDEARGSELGLYAVAGGERYRIPERECQDGDVKPGVRIQFVPQQGRWRGKLWVRKLLLRP